jgi:1,4-dihydroxy-2-naphthoyl-CoA hydrolase
MSNSPLEPSALEGILSTMPFARAIGIEILSASPTEVKMRLPWAEDRCTVGGALHGGALMALADSAGAVCAFLNMSGGSTTTVESKTNFFRAVRAGSAVAVSQPLHVGKRFVVVQTNVLDEATGKLVTQTTQTQAVLG